MARKLSADTPELTVPDHLIAALDANPDAGVDFACQMVHDIRESGAFDGVHLIPVSRYRQIAAASRPRSWWTRGVGDVRCRPAGVEDFPSSRRCSARPLFGARTSRRRPQTR